MSAGARGRPERRRRRPGAARPSYSGPVEDRPVETGTRDRLLRAAADLIAASPGETVPLRAICDAAGVRLPTLYHFFGSKEGLLDAVVEQVGGG